MLDTKSPGWYAKWRANHTVFSCGVTALIVLVQLIRSGADRGGQVPQVPSEAEVAMLAIAVAFFGVPHGATDHLVGSALFKRVFGGLWLPVFLVVYLAMMALVVLCWYAMPSLSLSAFLLMSVVHWGLGDVEEDLTPTWLLPVEVLVRGSVAVIIPCVAFRANVSHIFGWLVDSPADSSAITSIMDAFGFVLLPMALGLTTVVMFHISHVASDQQLHETIFTSPADSKMKRHLAAAAEVALLAAMCCVCSPLVAFVVYFCLWHSFRHIMVVSCTSFDDKQAGRAMLIFLLQASPFTIATLVLAWISWEHILEASPSGLANAGSWKGLEVPIGMGEQGMQAIAQVVMIGLSAVTVPHMIITEVAQVRQRAFETGQKPSRNDELLGPDDDLPALPSLKEVREMGMPSGSRSWHARD